MIKITILITIVTVATLVTSSSSQECPGPVSFNSSSFTIRGPCPNDTVLVAVGSTIQYRCDYDDRSGTTNIPYWYIPELSGTPFIAAEGSEHNITILNCQAGHSRDSTLTILITKQYLSNTLGIQCGLSSLWSLINGDRLGDNIISTIGKMVTHGSPRHLSTSVTNGIVMFQWSRPLASGDNVVFIYTVQLMTNTSSVPILSFNTTNTNITLSRLNITGNDRCIEYTSWSVSVENSYTMTDGTNGGNISVIFQEEPSFSTSNITAKISSCSSIIRLELSFTVSSLQPLHTLDYDVWLNDTINISYHSKHNTSITFTQHQLVIIEIPLVSIPHDEDQLSITVTISNECGGDTVEDLPVNGNNVSYCTTSTLLSHVISTSVHIPPQTTHVTLMLENLSVIPTILPTNKSTDTSSPSTVGVIIGCSFAGAFTFIIFSSVIVFIILYTKYSLLCGIDNINSPMNISPSTTMNQVYGVTTNSNPLSSTEQTQEEPEQQINVCYNSVKPQRHDNHDGGGVGLLGAGDLNSSQYDKINHTIFTDV